MKYKLELTKEPMQLNYIENDGGFNQLPEPYELSDFDTFWFDLSNYSFSYKEYRQVRTGNAFKNFNIYYFSNYAYAVASDKTVYRIGCNHKYKVISKARCYAEYECEKCGCTYEVDSSD